MKKIFLLFTTAFLLTLTVAGQGPGLFNYQGVARNSVGNVLQNKTISLRLSIHDGTANGPVVYSETRTVITNPFGLFNVQMGSPGASAVTGTIIGVNWATGNKYLKVEIDANGGSSFLNIGTAQLASVPYSFTAATAGDLTLPFNKTLTNAGGLFNLTNTGTGAAGSFTVNNAASATNAFTGTTNGSGSGVVGTHTSATGTAPGVRGESSSTDANAQGVLGLITSAGPGGFSAGVRGTNNGTGGLGIGVYGSQAGSGWGVYGTTPSGIGVHGNSTSGFGLYGLSTSGIGVLGTSNTGAAGQFEITNNANTSTSVVVNTNGSGIGLHARRFATTGTAAGVRGETSSQDANAVGVAGVVNSTTPGGFSAGIRGINNGTGGLGVGVYGSQAGSGWGVYGTTPTGIGVYGNSTDGIGLFGSSTNGDGLYAQSSTGTAGRFQVTNAANTSNVVNISTTGTGAGLDVQMPTGGARGINVTHGGFGPGVFASSGGLAVWGISTSISGAGVIGDNTFGEAVVGRNRGGNGVGAVVGRNDSSGYGVRGFNTKNGIGVLGQTGISGGTGVGGRFENVNSSNTNETVQVATNGIGGGISVDITNPANGGRGVEVTHLGVGPGVFSTSAGGSGVWGITSSISAAGVIGDNTFGEAVVGRNRGGNGVGAVVGRNDSSGYGVRGFNTKNGIGVLGQTGISGGTGVGGRFENVNGANSNVALIAATNGGGAAFLANNTNAAATDIAIFQKSNANVVRISGGGNVYANGAFIVGGADVAEYFEVEGNRNGYEPGDVLVISQSSDRKVERSSLPYSTLVSGVYATKPGMMLTERVATDADFSDMVPMGVIGVIPTKVCDEGGAIKRGDLLVTSSIPGVAMKADPEKVRVGQVIGKALQDHTVAGTGKINVLVSIK